MPVQNERYFRPEIDQIKANVRRIEDRLGPWSTSSSGTLAQQLAAINAKLDGFAIRTAIRPLPLLAIGNTTQAVTWQTPFVDTNYVVVPAIEAQLSVIGSLRASVQAGSITTSGCTIVIINSGGISIAAGQFVHVTAYRVAA